MTWQRREKILAATTGGLLVLAAIWFLLFSGDARSASALRAERAKQKGDVSTKQNLVEAAARDRKRLIEWQRRALPSDRAIAQSLYQHWLTALANTAHFRQLSVESTGVETHRNMYVRLSFKLTAHAGLADVTKFLYDFYSAGHLHQIRQMDLKPVEGSRDLDVSVTVDALSLPDATRKDKLSAEQGHVLKLAKLDDYREPLVKRDLFTPYSPGKSGMAENKFDAAQFAFVTGFTEVDGARQVWLMDRTAGKTWQLGEGQDFQIGPLRGTVRSIAPTREVVLDFDGHRRRLRDGENLRGGVAIPEPEKAGNKDGGASEPKRTSEKDRSGAVEPKKPGEKSGEVIEPKKASEKDEIPPKRPDATPKGQAAQELPRPPAAP